MTQAIVLERGAMRWHLTDPNLADLFDEAGPRLAEWQAEGRVVTLKSAPHRMLYRVSLPGLDFHLKYYPMNNARAVLRQLVRPSKARMEFDLALEVARRGVPTIEPLALGEAIARPGASYLMTRTLPETRSLAAFLENELPLLDRTAATRIRQRLAKSLGELMARMHDGGVLHDDLHPGNLLLALDDNEPSLYLIDLLMTRLCQPLDWASSRDNLVVLNRWFLLRSARTDRLRFWRAYEASRTHPLPAVSKGQRERALEAGTLESNLRFWRSLDRRCLGENRYFCRVGRGGVRGHASKDLPTAVVARFVENPDAAFDAGDARLLKNSRSATVAITPEGWIWKRFRVTAWTDPLAALVRPTAARRSWVLGHALRARGLPTPLPLLLLHRAPFGLPREGYLLTEYLPESCHLGDHLDRLRGRPDATQRVLSLVPRLADLVARLHRYRMSHRDLKASNVLVSSKPWIMPRTDKTITGELVSGAVAVDSLWLIDLVGVRQHQRVGRRRKVRDLARLHASFRDHPLVTNSVKLRFLKAYLGPRGNDPSVWKAYWRAIAAATLAKVERNLRLGRPLY